MKKYSFIILFLIPVIFFLSGNLLRKAQGPYYYNFYDPSYVYLINSLNLAQHNGYGVGHFDHPGTTVQEIGAALIYTYHLVNNNQSDIAEDVIKRPEEYLKVINCAMGVMSTLMLFLLGIFVFKLTGSILYSILIQFTPFSSMEIFYGYIIVTPDNFLIVIMTSFITVLIWYLFKNTNANDEKGESGYGLVIAFGIVTALGMSTKLNFLPIAIVPLLLINGIKKKLIYIGIAVVLFHIIIYPALENYGQFTLWIAKLIVYNGHYGEGEAIVINKSEFMTHLGLIFTKDIFFTFSYIVMFVTLLICLIKKEKIEKTSDDLLKK
ncbi:MAG: hypothetical protein LH629_03030, partial [Ignavibacteria bacterium]|nr:hypothetical protein [Ignavibacteria bacterium]